MKLENRFWILGSLLIILVSCIPGRDLNMTTGSIHTGDVINDNSSMRIVIGGEIDNRLRRFDSVVFPGEESICTVTAGSCWLDEYVPLGEQCYCQSGNERILGEVTSNY